jgi:hypothetical protein
MNMRVRLHGPQKFLGIMLLSLLLAGCQGISLSSLPAVPTHHRLPYAIALDVTSLNMYSVEPGAATWPLPPLRHYVTTRPPSDTLDKAQWKKVLTEYLNERNTFQHLVEDGEQSDLILELRVHLFIDPGASFKFDYNYWAQVEGVVKLARYDREVARQIGVGKAPGYMRQSRAKNELFFNKAVFQALDDLVTKLEQDRRLHPSSL